MGVVFDDDSDTSAAAPSGASGKVVFDDENGPKWSDLPGNIIPDAEEVGKGSLDTTMRLAKGVNDLPSDVLETGLDEFQGKNPLNPETSPLAKDAETIGSGVLNTVKGIPQQLENLVSKKSLIEHPVQNALTGASLVAPFLGGEGAASEGAELSGKEVPLEPMPDAGAAEKLAQAVPISTPEDKALPVVEPGSKTGDAHALFAYNDKFGPGGTPRAIYNVFGDPEDPAVQAIGHGSSVTKDVLDKNGVPITGQQPGAVAKYGEPIAVKPPAEPLVPIGGKEVPGAPPSKLPPDPNAPPPKASIPDAVKNYVNSKYQQAQARPGLLPKVGTYLGEEADKLRAKDIGLQSRQIQSMGSGYQGLEKARQLLDYAGEKGYFKAGLSDVERRAKITDAMNTSGKTVDAIRTLGDKRGAPPVDAMREQLNSQLTQNYGGGVNKATSEVNNVLAEFDKAPKTFHGMAELATKLNKSATAVKDLGQHPGPTTDAANIVAKMNNDSLRKTLGPQEADTYTQALRDYGANKKLEQATAGSARRELGARSNQRGILGRAYQEALDRGGYRMGGNIAKGVSKMVGSGKVKTLPQFFEELAHQSNEEVDNTINGMAKGGVVPQDVRNYVGSCK